MRRHLHSRKVTTSKIALLAASGPFFELFYFRRARGNPVEKPSKNRLDTIRGGPKGLRADIGSLIRFRISRGQSS